MKELHNIYDAKGDPVFIELSQEDRDMIKALPVLDRANMITQNVFKLIHEHAPWYQGSPEMTDIAIAITLVHMEEIYGDQK